MLLATIDDTSRPITAPIESSGNAVTDIGKVESQTVRGLVNGDAATCHPKQSDAEPATDDAPPASFGRCTIAASATACCNWPKL